VSVVFAQADLQAAAKASRQSASAPSRAPTAHQVPKRRLWSCAAQSCESSAVEGSSIWERRLLGDPVPEPPTTLLPPACTSPESAPPASDLPTRLTARAKPPLTQWAPPTGSSAPAPYPHLLAPFPGAPVGPLSSAPGPGRPPRLWAESFSAKQRGRAKEGMAVSTAWE
jgi:hypothetical protein